MTHPFPDDSSETGCGPRPDKGAFRKNKTSENGKLLDFLTQNNLYANTTQFKHKLAHITTFTSNLKIKSRKNRIQKQIDFI